jgi:succinate dehydrogenase/fumarate reductase cytochrome b subunit
MSGYRESASPSLATTAVLLMLVAGSIPALAARALILARGHNLLFLTFATPPLYVFSILLAARAGVIQHHGALCTVLWIAMGVALWFGKSNPSARAPAAESPRLRMIHGAAATCLLLGFLIPHLANHSLALWSVELHTSTMEWLRHWYRSEWIEPAMFALLATMIVTGVPLIVHHSHRDADAFRIIQMATGVYIATFLCAHNLAVLGGRSAGEETDWFFATGPNGLLDGRGMLIPYYILAVFFFVLHLGCGLRVVMLKHGVADDVAKRAVLGAAGVGFVVATVIAIAALGFQWNG